MKPEAKEEMAKNKEINIESPKLELGIPGNEVIGDSKVYQSKMAEAYEEAFMDASEAAELAEEKRSKLLKEANVQFGYSISTNEVTPSDLHVLFTQAGHAAASSGLEKLNVNVIISTANINDQEGTK